LRKERQIQDIIYEAMEKAKETIMKFFNKNENK